MRSSFLLSGLLASSTAFAQPLPADIDGESGDDTIIVSGYKESLATAAAAKRRDNGITEVIDAEGIADFPDMNLAESLQRVAGVAIDRDGGEGRTITVRGLSPDFTRVRINGLEALATTGGKDQASGSGSANRTRSFDFQAFASELFNRVTVRKSQSAELEEGSLGATVDLKTALPFDYDGLTGALSVEAGYNDLSRSKEPRISGLISNSWADGRLGALLSVSYSSRKVREEGIGSTRWENAAVAGSFGCFQTPGPCNNPAGVYSPPNSSWHPRMPHYKRLDYDWKRLGITGAVQYKPTERTLITLDGLYSRFSGTRQENYLSFFLSRGGAQNTRQTDVVAFEINEKNEMLKATFNDLDMRSEERHDVLSTDFTQFSVEVEQEIGDRLHLTGQIGQSRSDQDNPVQTTVSIDRPDSDGFSYDYTKSQKTPAFNFGFDVTDPANWQLVTTTALSDPSLIRLRPNRTVNRIRTARLDAAYELNDALRLKAGILGKQYRFLTTEERR